MLSPFLRTFRSSHSVGTRNFLKRHFSEKKMTMGLQTGIVGLPNVGKSTLFNALVGSEAAQAANFPFCTIEPNVGFVYVPDQRLTALGVINKSEKLQSATMEFVDIAGIVKGASEGAGLGNKFLSNIRQTDAIVHVVRCFIDDDIIHVDSTVDPLRDMEIINLELILADLAQIEKRIERVKKDKKSNAIEISALEKLDKTLQMGKSARTILPLPTTSTPTPTTPSSNPSNSNAIDPALRLTKEEYESIKQQMFLSMKPVIYAANVKDSDLATGNEMSKSVEEFAKKEGNTAVIVSAQVESELSKLDPEDKQAFLQELGVSEESCGLKALVRSAYSILGLQTYFTSGPTETRAWTIKKGSTAPQAAGVIHSDFEKGFIRAEVISYDDLIREGNEKLVKEKGLMRSEGREYVMQEGDVVLFRFN